MAKAKKRRSDLELAAAALEEEMVRAEVMSRAVRRIRLDTDEHITRAADELGQTLALPERLAERLQALSAAMVALQERQQAALEPLATYAGFVQKRKQMLVAHMQAFAELGKAAGAVGTALATVGTGNGANGTSLASVEAQLQTISDNARTLFEAAHKDDFPEIAREADILKQRMAALRKRLAQR